MRKFFNTTADCKPVLHYMVDLDGRLAEIKKMVSRGDYFTINRARQYGKTTLLKALGRYLQDDYIVISLDFQRLSHRDFETEERFVQVFSREIFQKASLKKVFPPETLARLKKLAEGTDQNAGLAELFWYMSQWCEEAEKPIVLMVDEVDSASNNQVFLDFLAQLRSYYIDRDEMPVFQSVILAGVYDIKNLKRKFVLEDTHKRNSPWNIAADFLVDMSFSEQEIFGMLKEYEADTRTGMDIGAMAEWIYDYTSGYPFLVSRICKLLDERILGQEGYPDQVSVWTKTGFLEAVKLLVMEKNALFESLIGKLVGDPKLREFVYTMLFAGEKLLYHSLNPSMEEAEMFGFLKNEAGYAVISNRIFEMVLYNWFLLEEALGNQMHKAALQEKNQFVKNGHLDMAFVRVPGRLSSDKRLSAEL